MQKKKNVEKETTKAKILRFLKWSKLAARFLAVCSTIVGSIAAIGSSSAASTGLALGAAGATSYAATKIPSGRGYEKIAHIAPQRIIRKGKEIENSSPMDLSQWSEETEKKQLKKAYSDWNA